jgi:hypothetical protein
LKPPPLDDDQIGWRVEFRPMDVSIDLFFFEKILFQLNLDSINGF